MLNEFEELVKSLYSSVGYSGYKQKIYTYPTYYWKLKYDDSICNHNEVYFAEDLVTLNDRDKRWTYYIYRERKSPQSVYEGKELTMLVSKHGYHMFFLNKNKVKLYE